MCLLGATCGTSQEIRTEYLYWESTLLPSRERRIDAYSGRTRDTHFGYDRAGRLTASLENLVRTEFSSATSTFTRVIADVKPFKSKAEIEHYTPQSYRDELVE